MSFEKFLEGFATNLRLPQPPREDVFFNQIIQNKLLERRIEKEQEWRERMLTEQEKQNELKLYQSLISPLLLREPKTLKEWNEQKASYDRMIKAYKFKYLKAPEYGELFPQPQPKKGINWGELFNKIFKRPSTPKNLYEIYNEQLENRGKPTGFVKG